MKRCICYTRAKAFGNSMLKCKDCRIPCNGLTACLCTLLPLTAGDGSYSPTPHKTLNMVKEADKISYSVNDVVFGDLKSCILTCLIKKK